MGVACCCSASCAPAACELHVAAATGVRLIDQPLDRVTGQYMKNERRTAPEETRTSLAFMGREKISRSENVAFPDLITPTVAVSHLRTESACLGPSRRK